MGELRLPGLSRVFRSRAFAQSLVEFALALPIFLYIVIGVVDLGRGVVANTIISNAAREGARAGIYPGTVNSAISSAINQESAFIGNIPVSTTGADPGTGNYVVIAVNTWDRATSSYTMHNPASDANASTERISGSQIIVTVHYRFRPLTPLLGRLIGSNINMTAQSTMMVE